MSDFKTTLNMFLKAQSDKDAASVEKALAEASFTKVNTIWANSRKRDKTKKRAYYFSAEFLIGRSLYNNLYNLGLEEKAEDMLGIHKLSLKDLEDIEDAALGNGGLGRLAACFLDSAACLKLPLMGYGIRYKFGLFKQTFQNGFQKELIDDWTRFGDPWSKRREIDSVTVDFADFSVKAVPYDIPIIGYGGKYTTTLRLWQAESTEPFDFELFNEQKYDKALKEASTAENISRLLYPNDSTNIGKLLRLRQQYFFCSASLQDIIRRLKAEEKSLEDLKNHITIQLNDTHPVISIPELIRLVEIEGYSFKKALEMSREIFCYTNHTVMPEALESWDMEFIGKISPEIKKIIRKIFAEQKREFKKYGREPNRDTAIIWENRVNMAYLASFCSKYINGVAAIHTDILKQRVLKDWYSLYPEKFQNKTNGITQRRWLALSNRGLSSLITELLGTNRWITDYRLFHNLKDFALQKDTLKRFQEIKHKNKEILADYIFKKEGKKINPDWIIDVQIKRLHEYKRQLLNILSILEIYFRIKEGSIQDFQPTVFLFGAKAAPGYKRAKAIIKLINEVSALIDSDETVREKIKVIFITNYDVSYAEKIIPAADVSEQISTAGTEASGTGNMKLMMNGAVTLGTLDGANIEIVSAAGKENNYIFGATAEDIEKASENYNPMALYESDASIKRCLDALIDGTLSDDGTGYFKELYDSLLKGADWHKPDHYFLLLDWKDYFDTRLKINADYKNREEFSKKAWLNIAASGRFSSDRTVMEYAKDIWHIK